MQALQASQSNQTGINDWFDSFVAMLRSHEVQLETNTAPDELKTFYENAISSNVEELVKFSKEKVQKFYITKMLVTYLEELKPNFPPKLAFDLKDSEVLVWAEINEDDEEFETRLILTEAKVNALFHDHGYDVVTTIVENGDGISIPEQYQIFQGA